MQDQVDWISNPSPTTESVVLDIAADSGPWVNGREPSVPNEENSDTLSCAVWNEIGEDFRARRSCTVLWIERWAYISPLLHAKMP